MTDSSSGRSRLASSLSGSFSGAFVSLQVPAYRTLWLAGLFSFIAIQMQFLLRGLLAWELTEREGALGLTYLCFGVALLISTPLGGVASDRVSKRLLLVGSQTVIVGAALVVGLPVVFGVAQFWMVLVSAVLQGIAFGFFGPARVALSAAYVGREQLGNAIALTMLSMNGTRIFAPSLAGVLAGVALVGIGGALMVSAVMSVVALVLLFLLPSDRPAAATIDAAGGAGPGQASAPRRSPLADIVDGVRYVAARPGLRRLVLSSFFVIMFGFNYVAFYPAMIEGVFGLDDAWVGYASSASAIGAVLVSVPLAGNADSPAAKPAMVIGGLLFGLGVMAFGIAPNFWVAFGVVAVIGASTTVYQSLSNTLALSVSDDDHQGRVQSLMQLSFAGFGIAAAPLGLLAEAIGLRSAIVVMGMVTVLAVVLYSIGEFGLLDRLRPARTAEDVPDLGDRKTGQRVSGDQNTGNRIVEDRALGRPESASGSVDGDDVVGASPPRT